MQSVELTESPVGAGDASCMHGSTSNGIQNTPRLRRLTTWHRQLPVADLASRQQLPTLKLFHLGTVQLQATVPASAAVRAGMSALPGGR